MNDIKVILQNIAIFACVLMALDFSTIACDAQTTPALSLLALSKQDHVLAIIDPSTLKIIARIPVGKDPHEVIASSDGKTAYVSNAYSEPFHEIDVIDLVNQKALAPIDITPLVSPHGLVFANNKLWFTAEGSKAVASYDPARPGMDWLMGTGQDRTHMIFVTVDGTNIYTTNVNAATVSLITDSLMPPRNGPGPGGPGPKPRKEWVQTVISVAKGSEGFDVSPDGKELWTAGAEDGNLSVIDINARKLVATIDAKVNGANRLKFTPDGKRVLISSLRTGDLIVYDVQSRKEIKRINVGHGGAGILIDSKGEKAYVGCTPDNYVAVVDLENLSLAGHIDLAGPDGLAWAVRP